MNRKHKMFRRIVYSIDQIADGPKILRNQARNYVRVTQAKAILMNALLTDCHKL